MGQEQPHILVVSHGDMGKELVRSTEMIVGTICNVHAVSLQPGISPAEFELTLRKELEVMPEGSIALMDIFGGTPFNTVMGLSREFDIQVVTGINMSMLIAADNLRGAIRGSELAKQVHSMGIKGCVYESS